MRIAIFGGTGLAGAPLLFQALAAGHAVTLLARRPEAVPPARGLTVVGGDALDPNAVATVVAGNEAVLSTLGGFGDNDACRYGTAHIVSAMRSAGVRRLVILQGFHLMFPGDPDTLSRRIVGAYLRLSDRELPRNTQAMADALRTVHDLDWTVLRIPQMVDGSPTGRVATGILRLRPWDRVFAGDVAATMLSVLPDPTTHQTAPMMVSGGQPTTCELGGPASLSGSSGTTTVTPWRGADADRR